MDNTGRYQNKCARALLLVIFFGLCLAWLATSSAAWGKVTEEWVRTFSGNRWGYEYPNAIHVDKQGNAYVTGYTAIIKYSPDGLELWNRHVGSTASCLDNQGNLYVTGIWWKGENVGEYVTCKYDNDGTPLWKARYHGPQNFWEEPTAIAVDSQGNVYVTGASGVRTNLGDYSTIKYNADGALLWAARYHGPRGGIDCPRAIAVDRRGNVYVTGTSGGGDKGHVDYATVKYSPDGEELWVRRYEGPRRGQDFATALAVDHHGNVYVTGESRGSGTNKDYATIKYGSDGRQLWVRRYEGQARAMAVDGQGNVHVTGYSWKGYPFHGCDYATVKYSPDGEELWVRRYHGPGNQHDYTNFANAIAVDAQGNIYVTGYSWSGYSPNGSHDYATIKYNPSGQRIWVRRYNGPIDGTDGATAIAVDDLGNVWVTGQIDVDIGTDYCTIRYRQRGRSWGDPY